MRVSGVHARVVLCVYVFAVVAMSLSVLFGFETVRAAQIVNRSLTLQKNASVTTGGSAPNADANHRFEFDVVTTAGIRSIGFQYCTTATGTCTAPTGLDASTGGGTTLGTVANLGSSPSYTSSAANAGYVAFTSNPSQATDLVVTLNAVNNPTAANTTFFARITTYTSSNASTGATDTGVVAASTAQTITVTGTMPEYIQFCTGATATANCGSVGTGAITFNQEFSPSDTATATSQMAASTNAGSGYVITVTGTTLTSGSNTIPQQGATAGNIVSGRGTSRFGINLVDNATPDVGSAIAPASNGSNYRANVATNFDTADSFALDLNTATAIARSDQGGGGPYPTDSQVYTISYFVNVSGSQAPGSYVATLNYVCTATF